MLKCRDPRLVYAINNVLPPSGEDRTVLHIADDVATLLIEYDGGSGQTSCVRLIFDRVAAVFRATFPGVGLGAFKCEQNPDLLGELVEYCASSVADEWTKYRHWSKRPTKHFQLILLHANVRVDIFAEGWRVELENIESADRDVVE